MKKFFNEWVLPFLAALAIFLLINIFVGANRVSGSSMYPTYHDGQFAIMNKFFYKNPNYGDVIIFHSDLENPNGILEPTKRLIKRIIALPGDTITVSSGSVYVNGEKLDETYLPEGTYTDGEITDYIVPENSYFVMGDNRGNSTDSRYLGAISKEAIIGKVIFTLL